MVQDQNNNVVNLGKMTAGNQRVFRVKVGCHKQPLCHQANAPSSESSLCAFLSDQEKIEWGDFGAGL